MWDYSSVTLKINHLVSVQSVSFLPTMSITFALQVRSTRQHWTPWQTVWIVALQVYEVQQPFGETQNRCERVNVPHLESLRFHRCVYDNQFKARFCHMFEVYH